MRTMISQGKGGWGYSLIDSDGYYVDGSASVYDSQEAAAQAAQERADALLALWRRGSQSPAADQED